MTHYMPDDDVPVYAISIAAQLSGLHPQTLRQYDRLGLVSPARIMGKNRLYSLRDIHRLREIAQLSAEGVTLAGIVRIFTLEAQLEATLQELALLRSMVSRPSTALVVWKPSRDV